MQFPSHIMLGESHAGPVSVAPIVVSVDSDVSVVILDWESDDSAESEDSETVSDTQTPELQANPSSHFPLSHLQPRSPRLHAAPSSLLH